jgi:NAD(P)H-hydrate epimerase
VIPIVTPAEMGAIDAAAPEPVEVLIGRAGGAVARAAVEMLGGTYGRRVVVLAGPGNNGNDGREAARRLRQRGVAVQVFATDALPAAVPPCDLVIDAAFGTGFRGSFDPPAVGDIPVLAVDIPSGVTGLTGEASGTPLSAARTVTFAALKPGMVLPPGASLAGEVTVADIGLDTAGASAHVIEATDVASWLVAPDAGAHKWQRALWLVAGSPGMEGAATLVATAAMRAGAGYVRMSAPGSVVGGAPTEAVRVPLPDEGWWLAMRDDLDRFGSVVIGNGLGTSDAIGSEVRSVVASCARPLVVDADALTALAAVDVDTRRGLLGEHVVLTPHDGEFTRLAGARPGADRLGAARALASQTGAVVLLKGGPTVVAHPDGRVLVCTSGDARLATAGTGDVLAGVIGALLAQGVDPFHAAAGGAFVHGVAAALGWQRGLLASDVAELLPAAFDRL